MEMIVERNILNHYLIFIDQHRSNPAINAKLLGIEQKEYIEILISCNGIFQCGNNSYKKDFIYFLTKEDAEKAIKKLEPYLIMAILTK